MKRRTFDVKSIKDFSLRLYFRYIPIIPSFFVLLIIFRTPSSLHLLLILFSTISIFLSLLPVLSSAFHLLIHNNMFIVPSEIRLLSFPLASLPLFLIFHYHLSSFLDFICFIIIHIAWYCKNINDMHWHMSGQRKKRAKKKEDWFYH